MSRVRATWYVNVPFFGKSECTATFDSMEEAEDEMEFNDITEFKTQEL